MPAGNQTGAGHRKLVPLCHNSGADYTCGGTFALSGMVDTLCNSVPVCRTGLLCRRSIGKFDFPMSIHRVYCHRDSGQG